jgi:hypothetical protein
MQPHVFDTNAAGRTGPPEAPGRPGQIVKRAYALRSIVTRFT